VDFRRDTGGLRGKVPQLIALAIVVIVIVAVSLDVLEDSLIEGGTSAGGSFSFLLNAVVRFAQSVPMTISSWGYGGVFLLMLLESSSLPFPSEIILPFAGYLISLGQLNFLVTLSVSILAGVTGSLIDYYIGMKGMDLIVRRKALNRLFLNKARVQTAERWFNKYGAATVFLSRMIPGFRTLVSFPAGAVKMPLLRFIAYTLAGCLVWNGVLIYIGVYVGANWQQVAGVSHYLIIGAAVAIAVALIGLLIKRKKAASRTGHN